MKMKKSRRTRRHARKACSTTWRRDPRSKDRHDGEQVSAPSSSASTRCAGWTDETLSKRSPVLPDTILGSYLWLFFAINQARIWGAYREKRRRGSPHPLGDSLTWSLIQGVQKPVEVGSGDICTDSSATRGHLALS